jgi:hypothetical protein
VASNCTPFPQQACNNFLATHPSDFPVSTTCSATEVIAWQKDFTGACLGCLLTAGCVDIQGIGGDECHDLPGGAGSADETACLNVFACDIGVTPAAHPGPAAGLTVNAFCGQGVSNSFCNTTPGGPCASQWQAGFPGQSNAQIQASVDVQLFPGGMGNSIATCANVNCTMCF